MIQSHSSIMRLARSARMFALVAALSFSGAIGANAQEPAKNSGGTSPTAQQDPSLKRLDSSPRHSEWVDIKVGDRLLHTFVVFPEKSENVTAIVLIHENKGLTDWVRSMADQVAEAGYIALAPDFLTGLAPGGGNTKEFPDGKTLQEALYKLTPDVMAANLDAAVNYAAKVDGGNGKVAVGGFCWGGAQTFNYATKRPDLAAAFVFYGSPPKDSTELQKISAPVYGFYGGNDNRITSTVEATKQSMQTAGKTYEPVVYAEAGHGFMRAGETAEEGHPNRKARDEAFARLVELLKKIQ